MRPQGYIREKGTTETKRKRKVPHPVVGEVMYDIFRNWVL
jgi:hypothetical protein